MIIKIVLACIGILLFTGISIFSLYWGTNWINKE